MRLAVFSGQYFWFDGRRYSTNEAFVKFMSSFDIYFEKVIFCDSVIRLPRVEAYVLDLLKTEVCPLPYFNVYSFWRNVLKVYPKIYRTVKKNIHRWDVVWLHVPHPISLIFAYICRKRGKPFFFVVRQNLMEQVKHRNRSIAMWSAIVVVIILEHICRRVARNNLTFTVGREMYKSYKKSGHKVEEIAVSLVSEKDIESSNTAGNSHLHKPVRLLSIGRLDPEKGVSFLIDAVEIMTNNRRLDVTLQIAGKSLRDEAESRLRQNVIDRGLNTHIRFLGYVPHGPELFQLYRDSDIFVVPSLTGEGVPQTLFEAMAFSIPIIATRVAGIPYVIRDKSNGLLISQASPKEICDAVQLLVNDSELRKRLTTNALSMVRHHTLEAERDRMAGYIEEFMVQAQR